MKAAYPALPPMADAPYLIALVLLEQDGQRALPLQGKSLREAVPADGDPGEDGKAQALELLVRVWQRSEAGALRRAAGDRSLLLAEVPLESVTEQLPALKARWLAEGNSEALLQELGALSTGLWSLSLEPRQPLRWFRLR